MSRRKEYDFISLIFIAFILCKYVGIKATINLIYHMFQLFNTILLQFNNTSILSFVFKYYITFPIVGIILSFIGSPRSKEGKIIGKILYFIIGYVVCLVLDVIAQIIF